MKIHGREITFLRNVWANCEFTKLADGDAETIEKKLGSDYITSQKTAAEMMAILSSASEMTKKFDDPDYKERPLTVEEALTLEEEAFSQLFHEALAAWAKEKPTIETTPKKGVKKTGKR